MGLTIASMALLYELLSAKVLQRDDPLTSGQVAEEPVLRPEPLDSTLHVWTALVLFDEGTDHERAIVFDRWSVVAAVTVVVVVVVVGSSS